jgi:hypothetical protein
VSKANITQLCFEFTESLLNFFKQTQPQSIDHFFGKLQEILPCIHKFNAIFDQIRINYIQGNIEEFASKITEFSSGIHAELGKHIDKAGQNIQQFSQDTLQKVDEAGQNIQQLGNQISQNTLQKVDEAGKHIQQLQDEVKQNMIVEISEKSKLIKR